LLTSAHRIPWLVRMHYRMRTISFALMFVAYGLHMVEQGQRQPIPWLLLGMAFLVYPHVQFLRARKASDPVATETRNLLVDSVLLGMTAAGMGFPAWITFSGAMGTLSNNAANRGWSGVIQALLALVLGMALWLPIGGLRWAPGTDTLTSSFCMLGLGWYLLAMNNMGFERNRQLSKMRQQLQERETQLLSANKDLQCKLFEIDALQTRLSEQANRDPLTGLYNRRYLGNTLDRELARCQRDGLPLSIILLDIDHFKKVNDSYGHPAGDQVLVHLGHLLMEAARSSDVACRYGGEEFLLLLPTMPLDAAMERAEDLRVHFSKAVVTFGEHRIQATISLGVAVFPEHARSAEDLIRSADAALYQAKNSGRNQVRAWVPSNSTQATA
jgi:diguanylate cyclase